MLYFVKGVFIEPNNAERVTGKPIPWISRRAAPTLATLENDARSKKIVGGFVAGAREVLFIMEASSNEAVGEYLRSLPFWIVMKWTVVPLQSVSSVFEQDKNLLRKEIEALRRGKKGEKQG